MKTGKVLNISLNKTGNNIKLLIEEIELAG